MLKKCDEMLFEIRINEYTKKPFSLKSEEELGLLDSYISSKNILTSSKLHHTSTIPFILSKLSALSAKSKILLIIFRYLCNCLFDLQSLAPKSAFTQLNWKFRKTDDINGIFNFLPKARNPWAYANLHVLDRSIAHSQSERKSWCVLFDRKSSIWHPKHHSSIQK